ncbi:MAG: T9SS type A sorting domain-containing protein [Marinoscillum sp.]
MTKLYALLVFLVLFHFKSYSQILFDGFENWGDTSGIVYPIKWDVKPEIDTGYANLIKAQAISEGDLSILLRSTIPGFEGPEYTSIKKELPFNSNLVSIVFFYRCEGQGSCIARLVQSNKGESIGNFRTVWQIEAADRPGTHKATIDSLSINSPFDYFTILEFIASPKNNGAMSWGTCEFTIDSVVVKNLDPSAIILSHGTNPNFSIYPNPTREAIQISSKSGRQIIMTKVINQTGQEISTFDGSPQFIQLPKQSGIYLIQIIYKHGNSDYFRVVKE